MASKRKRAAFVTIDIPIYEAKVAVYTNWDGVMEDIVETQREWYEGKNPPMGCVFDTEMGTLGVYVAKKRDINTIAHECFHAACFILGEAGVDLRPNRSNEAYAYLVGWLTERVYAALNNK